MMLFPSSPDVAPMPDDTAAELREPTLLETGHDSRNVLEPPARLPSGDTANAATPDSLAGEEQLPPFPKPWRHPIAAIVWMTRTVFGLLSLIVLLAVIAAIPIVNFIALGYLLEIEGRVGRSGRFRDAFPLINAAPRLGSIAVGIWLWLLPLRLLAGAATDASIIDPEASAAAVLQFLVTGGWVLVTIHVCLALARGGSLTCFFRPIKNVRWLAVRVRQGDYFDVASDRIRSFVSRLRLRHHFWLGLRGFAGAMAWLFVPTALFAVADGASGPSVLATVIGGALLAVVLAWMPFLQARMATEDRLVAAFSLGEVRRLFAYAPLAWLFAIIVVYVLALPLYLFKAFLLPQDAMWPITLIFIVSIYPARIVTGWAYHRAIHRREADRRSGWFVRWTARLGIVPLLAAYVFLLHFTQFIGANGTAGLFEHHAFLLPWAGAPSL